MNYTVVFTDNQKIEVINVNNIEYSANWEYIEFKDTNHKLLLIVEQHSFKYCVKEIEDDTNSN